MQDNIRSMVLTCDKCKKEIDSFFEVEGNTLCKECNSILVRSLAPIIERMKQLQEEIDRERGYYNSIVDNFIK